MFFTVSASQWFILALVISFFYVIPIGMIEAITNQQVGLNVITELIIGYGLPGRPVAMMMFKTWGYITMAQGEHCLTSLCHLYFPDVRYFLALTFASDFKLGHYMKIPPRAMFWAQVVATVVAGTVQLGVQAWMFTNIPDMCSPDQKDGFICPATEVFGTASIIWGVIGPARQFSKGQVYYGMSCLQTWSCLCVVLMTGHSTLLVLPYWNHLPPHHLPLQFEVPQQLASLPQVSMFRPLTDIPA